MTQKAAVRAWLEKQNDSVFTFYASLAAFSAYFCMYAFRKPFAAGQFAGLEYFGMDYKTILVIAQLVGYALSKGIGIKVIAEVTRARRPVLLILFMAVAEAALVLFAVVPPPWNTVFLFLNGLPLGMIWGLVFSYVEGRKRTDIIALALCSSFVLASGFVKTAGKAVLNLGVTEFSMPFVTGLIFFAPLLAAVWMLESLPPPTAEEQALRTERIPMDGRKRLGFLKTFGPGFVFLLTGYVILAAFRDFRDNYMADIWQNLGRGRSSTIFTATEAPATIGVLFVLAFVLRVKDNFRALVVNHLAIIAGFGIVGAATLLYEGGILAPSPWMILVGFGLFLSFIPFNGLLYDSLIAAFSYKSNAGFLIYVGDFVGYTGSVGILLYKSLAQKSMAHVRFFVDASYILSVVGIVVMTISLGYFTARRRSWRRGR
jgi:hypothetical protein